MNNLKLQVMLEAMDKLSAPLKNVQKQITKTSKLLNESKQALRGLEKEQGKIDSFKKMRDELHLQTETVKKLKDNTIEYRTSLDQLKTTRTELSAQQKKLNRQLNSALNDNRIDEVKKLQEELKLTDKNYEKVRSSINSMNKRLREEQSALKNTSKETHKKYTQLRHLKKELEASGVDIHQLSKSETDLANKMRSATKEIEKQQKAIERLNKVKARQQRYRMRVEKMKQTSERFQTMGQRSMISGATLLAPTVGIGRGVASMTQTAAQFEEFKAVLETTEGNSTKAQKSLDWISNFATKTPYKLANVTEAFVRLRAYGMDPTNGLLTTLGDTSSAMGKPIMQAVEAIADAVTGENERLKEFGIKASVVKGTNIIEYAYTDKDGKQQMARVNKNNRKEIEKTLMKIWNAKYSDAMERRSKTITGIWSNLQDQWVRFQQMVMQTGAFDWIKKKLKGVLDTIDKMAQNGELQKWAEDIGAVIKEVAQGFWELGQFIFKGIKWLATLSRHHKGLIATFIKWSAILGGGLLVFGGFANILSFMIYPILRLGLGVVSLGQSFLSMIPAITRFGVALLTNPITLYVAGIMLIIGAIYLLYKKWDKVTAFINKVWKEIQKFFSSGIGNITKTIVDFSPLGLFHKIFSRVLKYLGIDIPESLTECGKKIIDGLISGIKDTIKAIGDIGNWIDEKLGISKAWDNLFGDDKETAITVKARQEAVDKVTKNTGLYNTGVQQSRYQYGYGSYIKPVKNLVNKWSGGFVGSGGKYEPKGIVHGGEYVMTKEATQRLGIANLNKLNYGKATALATLASSVALAQPMNIKVDNRPLLSASKPQTQAVAPVSQNINITINASAGQSEQEIARIVMRKLEEAQRQKQAKARSSYFDR
ncbi:tape measure protein [Pasteurella skyensis]|uniref:tape measure protein n=1 Tax=Phocoenobacter skyensis TaxID=97481 RepID=UPI0027504205|nr:tape measure protein [Pasteurella skyensis]MDP8176351.1 tape measure protein [Pasteurella skyensis]MDP8199136.1 tape measure protein [Pasteurella skyensis]